MRTGTLRDALGALKTPCKFKNRSEFEGLKTGLAQFPLGHHAMDKGAKYARIRPFIRLAARVCQPAASRMQAMSRRRLEPAHSLAAR